MDRSEIAARYRILKPKVDEGVKAEQEIRDLQRACSPHPNQIVVPRLEQDGRPPQWEDISCPDCGLNTYRATANNPEGQYAT